MSVNNVAIVTIGENYCRFHFQFTNKGETVEKIKKADLSEKKNTFIIKNIYYSNLKEYSRDYDRTTKIS